MLRLQERSGRPQGWTPKEDFKIDPCETAAAGGELAYSCNRYMGSISTERRSRNISPDPFASRIIFHRIHRGTILYGVTKPEGPLPALSLCVSFVYCI